MVKEQVMILQQREQDELNRGGEVAVRERREDGIMR
jgi:hypothetical protein